MDFLNIDDGTNGAWRLHYQPVLPSATIHEESPGDGQNFPDNTTKTAVECPQSAPSAVSAESGKRKRGRPRKYPAADMAAGAKRLLSADYLSRKNKGSSAAAASVSDCRNTGNSFNAHIISVAPGEDVCQKVMMFMQQNNCDICVFSASGSISNASLSLAAKPGMNTMYQGLYDIISLSGSYVHRESGERSGGLSVSLSSYDGQVIGGAVSGPLTAANQIQIIVGTFIINSKNDTAKSDNAACVKLTSSSPTGDASLSVSSSKSPAYSPHFQTVDENPFLSQHQPVPLHSIEWGGNTGSQGMLQCPTNGDFDLFGN